MKKTALPIAVSCAAVVLAGSPAGATLAATAQSVTLSFVRFYDNACNCYKARASGQISSGAAGEEVVILKQWCGRSFGTADAAAQTRDGGFFETEIGFVPGPEFTVSAIYRARWSGHLSEPVFLRGRLSVSGKRLGGRRQQVTVSTQSVNPANLKRRMVVLQRQTGSGWTRVASARLAPHRVRYYTFVASFTVPRRGWTLRALVPAKSAAPCFVTSASKTWRS